MAVWVGPAPSSLTYSEFLHHWVSTTSAVECILCPTSDRTKVSERGKFEQKGKIVPTAVFIQHTFYYPSCIPMSRVIFCFDVGNFI